ncbi:MAG: hypothetical protein ABI609_13320 [Acidobacteriota bacterium]
MTGTDNEIGIELDESRFAFSPLETLRGTVAWQLDRAPTAVEIRLLWYTTGKGDQDVGVVETVPFDTLQASDRRRFEIVAPIAPPSFSGQLISLQWAIEATASPGGETARVDLVIAPGGVEKRLELAVDPLDDLPASMKPMVSKLAQWAARRQGR